VLKHICIEIFDSLPPPAPSQNPLMVSGIFSVSDKNDCDLCIRERGFLLIVFYYQLLGLTTPKKNDKQIQQLAC